MLNGNEMKAFYRIFFPKRPDEGGLAARVPDVNETRLNDNFKTIGDEFRKIWEFIKNGFKTKSLTVDGDASIGGDASVGGQLSAGSAALGDTNVNGSLDVDGSATFDGGVTIGGVLDVTNRRCDATLSAAGWYRVMQYTGSITGAQWGSGVKIDFAITTVYNTANNSLHNISMVGVYHQVAFVNELSYSNATIVDKIRYTYGDDGNGYVDIHYDNSGSNHVSVDFVVHNRQSEQASFSPVALAPVADSPSGETILTEYTFGANGTFLQNINGFLNPERITIANGATGNIWFASSSSAYLLSTSVSAKGMFIASIRTNSSGSVGHRERTIGDDTLGITVATSTNTLSITNNSGNELQILILRF